MYWAYALNQGHWCKGLILAVISQKLNLLFSHLGSSMGYRASRLLSQGPQPLVYLFKEEAQCLYLGQTFPFLACFWTTCIPAAIDKSAKLNHSPVTSGRGVVFVLKRHCFFGRAVSVWTRRGCSYHTYFLRPKVLYLSAFNKSWKQIWRQFFRMLVTQGDFLF